MKTQKSDVIAYQIRQSFKPGEITPEEANRLGHELAMRFTKGKFSFIVATHTDRAHIHNHIVFNSTTMDGSRKFKNFWFSGLALQHVSDLVCLENGLSVITPALYSGREKRTTYPKRENLRSVLCGDIDTALRKNPVDFEEFLRNMEQIGYEIKRGKNTAVKGRSQKRPRNALSACLPLMTVIGKPISVRPSPGKSKGIAEQLLMKDLADLSVF